VDFYRDLAQQGLIRSRHHFLDSLTALVSELEALVPVAEEAT
jgi:hypothetical protein